MTVAADVVPIRARSAAVAKATLRIVVSEPSTRGAQALAKHGFDGQRLQKLAQRIATDYLRGKAATLQSRREDLVSFLCLRGIEAALRYDDDRVHSSYGSNGGDPFQSYLADVMELRITDFYRRKSEGFGDRRYGFDGMVDLRAEDEAVDPDFGDVAACFERWVDDGRLATWVKAAKLQGLSFGEFMMRANDLAARKICERANAMSA